MIRALLAMLLFLPWLAHADSLDAVINSGELQIETSVSPASDAVPGLRPCCRPRR